MVWSKKCNCQLKRGKRRLSWRLKLCIFFIYSLWFHPYSFVAKKKLCLDPLNDLNMLRFNMKYSKYTKKSAFKKIFFFVCMQSWIFFSSEGWRFLSVFMSSFKMVAITHFHSQVGTFTETKHRNWKFKIRDRIIKSYIQNTLTNFGMFQIFCLSKRDFKNFSVIILQFINLKDFNKII